MRGLKVDRLKAVETLVDPFQPVELLEAGLADLPDFAGHAIRIGFADHQARVTAELMKSVAGRCAGLSDETLSGETGMIGATVHQRPVDKDEMTRGLVAGPGRCRSDPLSGWSRSHPGGPPSVRWWMVRVHPGACVANSMTSTVEVRRVPVQVGFGEDGITSITITVQLSRPEFSTAVSTMTSAIR